MAWRFKASKYKNAAPIVPKPEACIRDICVGSYQTYGNNIASSGAFMAFNWEHTGSSVAVLPLEDCGRKSKTMPLLHGHTDTVTDLSFSPFHDGLLATASQDCLVKIWHIPEKGLESSLFNPECIFPHKQRRVETVGFHPTADGLLYSTALGCITLFDLAAQKEIFVSNEHPDVIQSASWREDGTVLATSCKDKCVRVVDPRSNGSAIQLKADSHQSIKDSRVVWLGNQGRILTTGFDPSRLRQVIIRDVRNFTVPEKTLELDCSTGILMPLFDSDTNMLFLAGKGDTTINYLEVTDKDPYLIEGLRHTGEQTKGACLVPKRALKVMEGEVNRVLQLTSNTVIPIMYQVPRKTYRDFHSDLYPETTGYKTDLTAVEWMNGVNKPVPKISLDPAKRELGDAPMTIHRGNLNEFSNNIANKIVIVNKKATVISADSNGPKITDLKNTKIMGAGGVGGNNGGGIDIDVDDNRKMFKRNITNNKYKTDSEKEAKAVSGSRGDHDYLPTPNNDDDDDDDNDGNGVSEAVNTITSPDIQSKLDDDNLPISHTAPKPMPRTSRNNSLNDGLQINCDELMPRPRPRTTATTTYKPRLGPKPFSSNSTEATFDKVFAVPVAPGSQENINQIPSSVELRNGGSTVKHQKSVEENKSDLFVEIEIRKAGEHQDGLASEENGLNKSLPTSERRKSSADDDDDSPDKLFEHNHSESSENSTEGEDKTDADILRFSATRNSIAERRRLYENRSKSTAEKKSQSPVPLRRELSKVDQLKSPPVVEADSKRASVPESRSVGGAQDRTESYGPKKSGTETAVNITTKRTSTVFGKVSKFRHLKGTTGHKSTHIENLRNLSRQIPGECNGFHANHERVAVPLSGPGGKIAIFELSRTGRLPDGVIPSLVNGGSIMDFQWDPFDPKHLAVACDDGIVKFWRIDADDGLKESTNVPEKELTAHADKIYFVRFHPLAKNVFLTASYDMTLKLWDVGTLAEKITLNGHTDQVFDFAWSPCGNFGATLCKDGKIRVYNPRKSEMPIREGNGPVGTRGGRITWALGGQFIVCTGFDRVSERQICVYNAHKLDAPLTTTSLDVSPSILIPFYDEDSSTLFATGKGDSTIYCYEITDEEPYICPLSHHRCNSLHQGLSFLTKNHCDVASVEFSKAYRLTNTTIEPISFTVPRIKIELFQDDLFPPTRITWEPTMSADEWYSGIDRKPAMISLQPEGMDALSTIQQSSQPKKPEQHLEGDNAQKIGKKSVHDKIKQQEIQKSVSARMEYNTKLEQDEMEGVDEIEWQENNFDV